MFALTTLVYPVVLALLCVGAGLLVDRVSGGFLPRDAPADRRRGGADRGLAADHLRGGARAGDTRPRSRSSRWPATLVAWPRVRALAQRWRAGSWQLLAPVLAYVLALAPVLLAGRPTFSSYMALSDSAVHMMGADFLMRHGQDYAHLDLRNSYGQFINDYYNTYYPSGADTLFGGERVPASACR